jgi:hypothetical protein
MGRTRMAYSEADMQRAITEYHSGLYSSKQAAAQANNVPPATLRYRLAGRTSPSQAHETQQILSNAEEKTLVRWITRLTSTGFPASPALVVEMADEIRRNRLQLSRAGLSLTRPIGEHWIDRFRARHTELSSVWSRQIEHARYAAASVDVVQTWFDAVTDLRLAHQYDPSSIYNMDESGFAVGTSQSSRVLVNIRDKVSWKVVSGRQEWVTAIECVSAAGQALPPLVIFKAKHLNTAWIPVQAPPEWRFSTSKSGWTSDSHAYEWLTTVFEPQTRPSQAGSRRLLVLDGHGSHMTANVIAFCMENEIDLLVLPPHCSHILQPLDVSIFAPLKRALAIETDSVARLDPGRVARTEWTQMYIRAREKAFTSGNIVSGWKATGLQPLSPIEVLSKLPETPNRTTDTPRTPTKTPDLDTALLCSSPPDGTELRRANTVLRNELAKPGELSSTTKRYIERMTHALEMAQSENVTLRKELMAQERLLRSRQNRRKGKRVALKGKFVLSTNEVLEIARETEANAARKKRRQQQRSRSVSIEVSEDGHDMLEKISSDSESDCIVVATSTVD